MDKLMRDMEKLCNTTERLLSDDWTLVVDGGTEIRTPLSVEWEDQVLEDNEMDRVLRHDCVDDSDVRVVNDIMFDTETQALLEELHDMKEFFIDAMDVASDMGSREIAMATGVVELLIMLDKELVIYNNTLS